MATSGGRTRAIVILAAAAAALAVGGFLVSTFVRPQSAGNPFAGTSLYIDPDSTAQRALASATDADRAAIAKIADTPSAIWLLPETYPTASIAAYVDGVATDANGKQQTPVFVVYGIPDRDCAAKQSAGGLTPDQYPDWIAQIARGLAKHTSVVILEPDALALAPECDNVGARTAQIRAAVSTLVPSGASIYLDAGHSNFRDAATIATLLKQAGIDQVRGFSSNVANFNSTADEVAYDQKVSDLTGGAHFVIDTSRNGSGPASDAQFCNPPGRTLGPGPVVISDGTAHDANLWIKNPGESDGACNGGPPAGQWWNAGAVALAGGQ
ncbi:MAG: hypothetical protein JWR53_1130 [Glaciihabitans sp.]|jgi:endoglucanase|nr:hypothetical protein [Glaciihabitans sp.]MDQ1555992.1 endoglucanase [Actinomycetota bacterium]